MPGNIPANVQDINANNIVETLQDQAEHLDLVNTSCLHLFEAVESTQADLRRTTDRLYLTITATQDTDSALVTVLRRVAALEDASANMVEAFKELTVVTGILHERQKAALRPGPLRLPTTRRRRPRVPRTSSTSTQTPSGPTRNSSSPLIARMGPPAEDPYPTLQELADWGPAWDSSSPTCCCIARRGLAFL